MPALLTHDWQEPRFDFITQQVLAAVQNQRQREEFAQTMAQKLNEMADERAYRDSQVGLRGRELDFQSRHADMVDARQAEKNEILRTRYAPKPIGTPPELPMPSSSGGVPGDSTGAPAGSAVLSGLTEDASPSAGLVRAMNSAAAPDPNALTLAQASPYRDTTDLSGAPTAAPSILGPSVLPQAPLTASDGTTAPQAISLAPTPNLDSTSPGDRLMAAANPAGGNTWAPPAPDATASDGGVSSSLVDWMKKTEGFSPKAFQDGKQLSVGYGTVATSPNETLTEPQAHDRLVKELTLAASEVDQAAANQGVKLAPAQRDALISYQYNTGKGASAIDNSGGSLEKIASAIKSGPVTQNGTVLPGLVTRRQDEFTRFTGVGAPTTQPSPSTALNSISDQLGPDGVARYNAVRELEVRGAAKPGSAAAALAQEMALIRKPAMTYNDDGTIRLGNNLFKQTESGPVKIGTNSGAAATAADLTKGMTFVPEHNTFKRDDGSEWYVNGNKLLSYRPHDTTASRWVFGSDGKSYALGKNGEPMQPIPDGVTVQPGGKIQTVKDSAGNVFKVGADSTLSMLIPAQAKVPPKIQDQYLKDMQSAEQDRSDYEAKKAALDHKTKSVTNGFGWFGISQDEVEKAKKAADDSAAKVALTRKTYPALGGAAPAPAAPAVSAPPAAVPVVAPVATPSPAPTPAPASAPQAAPAASASEDVGGTVANGTFLPSNTEVRVGPDGKHTALPVLSGAQARTLLGRGFAATYIDKDSGKVFSLKAPSQQ